MCRTEKMYTEINIWPHTAAALVNFNDDAHKTQAAKRARGHIPGTFKP